MNLKSAQYILNLFLLFLFRGILNAGMDAIGTLESGQRPSRRRSFNIQGKQKRRRSGCGRAIARRRKVISYYIFASYEVAFEKFGFFLACKPLVVLLFLVFIIVASCLGFIRLSVEQPSSKQFIMTDSQSRFDLQDATQFFPILEAHQEQIVMIPKDGQNILSEECLKDMLLVHQTVMNISDYRNLCFRQLLPKSKTKTPAKQKCIISSPLELAGADFGNLSNLTSILACEWTNSTTVLSTGQFFSFSVKQMLSKFQIEKKTNPPTARADALRVIYFIRKATNEDEKQQVHKFETSFERRVTSTNNSLKCASVYFKTEKAITDAFQNVLQPQSMPFYFSVLAMVLFVCIVVYLSPKNITCLTTVLFIILSVLFPLTCASGVISMAGISVFPTFLLIPFLFLGKATSDVVLFLQEWERQRKVLSLQHRTISCVTRAGITHVFPTLCGTILFGIAINSSFDAISDFFLVALIVLVIVSVASIIITLTLLLLLEKHLKVVNNLRSRSRHGRLLLPNVGERGPLQRAKAKWRHFAKTVTKMLTSVGGKFIAFFLLGCIIILCALSALQPGERTSGTANLYRQNDNFNQFKEAKEKFFQGETDVSIVFSQKTNYSQPTVQDQVINICTTVEKASYSQETSACWMAALQKWAKHRNMSCSNSEFYKCLNIFLNQSKNVAFEQDVRFENNNPRRHILASRIHINIALQNSFNEDRMLLEKLRQDLSKQSSLKASPVSDTFFELDDFYSLETETVFALVIAIVVVFALCLLSSLSFRISSLLAVTFGLLILETAAIMKTWEIHLNHITFISLFLTIGLAHNLSLQVAYAFVFSEKQNVRERMYKALCSVGWPVFIAALLEASGSISLGCIYPSLQDIFFRLIPPVFALGLIHALVIFPPIMTLFFEFTERFDSSNEVDILAKKKSLDERGTSMRERAKDVSQAKPMRPGISIVGIGCRFPGANSKELFWNLLEQGKSSIASFPKSRGEQHDAFFQFYHSNRFVSGRHCAVNGSYLEEINHFDNEFFGISRQEARSMDPQQRILLEVVYEAIEDAGMRLEDLQRCKTGVFLGVMNLDYGTLILTDPSNYMNINQFSFTGFTASILANRISFCLNLTGPSIAVDTACSSSLTALKLACDNLHNGDCEIAIVCAPNIVIDHALQIVASMAGLLAPDGRCKSFDASGDGYGRGEGFAAVILKLSDAALTDGDDEYCEIIACGMNNDGQNAVPMTAPSAKIQAELSRMVLEQSGLSAQDVDYVEAHGTGTAIGDVVEVTSIADTYTREATDSTRKLRIGSVKSNLNHTESTSGLAGLIKVALMVKNK